MAKLKIDSLSEQLNEVYKSDTTLDYLKQFQEDRKILSQIDFTTAALLEPTMQDKIANIESLIGSAAIQEAFKSHTDYESYANPILSSIHDKDYSSLQESMKIATESLISNDYLQTIKATDMLSNTIEKAKVMGFNEHIDSYSSKLADTISQYTRDTKLNVAQDMLGLASTIDTDMFQYDIKATENMDRDFTMKPPDIDDIAKHIPTFEMPKYEDTIMGKADKQLLVLEKLALYISSQTEKIEFQNEIATSQNNKLKEQNVIIKDQVKDTAKTSKTAFWTAICSIGVAVMFSIITILQANYIYMEEDKSDNKNYERVIELLKANNNNKVLKDLVLQLKEQNKNILITNKELAKQNKYFKVICQP